MAAERKEEILAAAYEIVGTEGLEGLHARSVAARIGINHAAVHYHFPKRADLLLASAEYAIKRFCNDRDKLLRNARGASARIDANLAIVEAYCKPKSRFIKNWVSFFVAAIEDRELRPVLAAHLNGWMREFSRDLAPNRKSLPFNDPELLVATLLGLMICSQTLGGTFDVTEKLDLLSGYFGPNAS